MTALKILSAAGLVAAIMWLVYEPSFEPVVAVLGALTALISLFVVDRRKKELSSQKQSVSGSSTGIQAGGNVHIGSNGGHDRND